MFSFFLMLLWVFSLNAQLLVNPEKLPRHALNFMVVSDMGKSGASSQKNVSCVMGELAQLNNIAFIAVAGDPIHDNGVKSTDDPEWESKFENIYTAPSLQKIPWYVVSGNHEYHGNVQAILDYSKQSARWKAPSRYYAVKKKIGNSGECLLLFIDTAPLIDKYRENERYSDAGKQNIERELNWIDSTLAFSTDRWKIVIGHHPVFADTDKQESERSDMQRRVEPILEKRKTDLYICGHVHDFQYIKPEEKRVSYIVNSSAAVGRPASPIKGTLFCSSNPGITLCSITRGKFTFYFYNHKGEIIYKGTIKKAKEGRNKLN